MKKRILVLLLVAALATSLCVLVSCGGLNVTLEDVEHGSASLNVTKAKTGEEVVVTLTPDAGYFAAKVTVNGKEQQIEDNEATFVMPDTDARVIAVFEKIQRAVNISNVIGGEVSANAETYSAGDNVTLTVRPDYGYALASLSVDGSAVSVTNNRYTFVMPDKNVDVVPSYSTSAQVTALPNGSLLKLTALAPAGGEAAANVFAEFADSELTLTAYVADSKVISSKDGMYFYFGTTDYANGKISQSNLAVKAYADQTLIIEKGGDGGYAATASVDGVSVSAEPWSAESGKITGYVLTVSVPYNELGVTKSTAQSKLTLLPYLVNSDKTGLAFGAAEATIDEYYVSSNADTYPAVSVNGFADNYYMFGSGQVGSYKDVVVKGSYWNTSGDYNPDSKDYASRKVTLKGHDAADNNLAFTRSAGVTSYVKATFKVTALHDSGEGYPKFGLTAYDVSAKNNGVFFYVDAEASKKSGVKLEDVRGTSLGHSRLTNGSWGTSWTTLAGTEGSFDLETKQITLAMSYNKGFVYMYCNDKLVGATAYPAAGGVVLGVKSFGLGLEVTDYEATNNANDPAFVAHSSRGDSSDLGDNASGYAYTEGWQFKGGVAENTGSGDQIVYVKDVTASADFYAEATVRSSDRIGNDEWTKVGFALKNKDYTVFAYIDLAYNLSADQRVSTNFAMRKESGANEGNWAWEIGVPSTGTTIEDKSVTLGIAKLGATIYFIVDGNITSTYVNRDLADEQFVAGIMGCNRRMEARDGSGTMKVDEVKSKLGMIDSQGVEFDGVLDDSVWTEKVLSNTQTFAADAKKGTKLEVAAVKGEKGVYVAVTLYSATKQREFPSAIRWSDVSNVEFKFADMNAGNKNSKDLSHFIAFYNTIDNLPASSGSIVNLASKSEETTLSNGAKGYKTVVEFFIAYKYFVGHSSAEAELPFYVWTCSYDDVDRPAMNITYENTMMYVTDEGLVVKTSDNN